MCSTISYRRAPCGDYNQGFFGVFRLGGSDTTAGSTQEHHQDEGTQPPAPQPTSPRPIPRVMFARSCHGTNLVSQLGPILGILSPSTDSLALIRASDHG